METYTYFHWSNSSGASVRAGCVRQGAGMATSSGTCRPLVDALQPQASSLVSANDARIRDAARSAPTPSDECAAPHSNIFLQSLGRQGETALRPTSRASFGRATCETTFVASCYCGMANSRSHSKHASYDTSSVCMLFVTKPQAEYCFVGLTAAAGTSAPSSSR